MSFTRYNYDDLRTAKLLQESTGPCRYVLNVPGPAKTTQYIGDPQVRLQGFAANNQYVKNGHPIDIDSDLKGITRLLKGGERNLYPNKGVVQSQPIKYRENNNTMMKQTRVTHPAREYRHLEQTLVQPLLLNPQENVCFHFENNLNTRLLERDSHVPKLPCL